jgi:predicted ATPase
MLSFKWNNFRCFPDTGWIDIKPLTVLIGPNNSGKTSLITPLLLLKQTLECGDDTVPLMTKGPLLDIGSYKDLIARHDTSLPLRLSLRFHHHDLDKGEKLPKLGYVPPGEISVSFTSTQGLTPNDFQLEEYEVFDSFSQPYLSRRRISNDQFSLQFYPNKKLSPKTLNLIERDQPVKFIFTDQPVHTLFKERLKKRSKSDKGSIIRSVSFDEGTTLYFAIVSTVEVELKRIFGITTFIGPLREATKRLYEFSGETPKNVGIKGESTPEIIARGLDKEHRSWIQKWIAAFEFGGILRPRRGAFDTFYLEVTRIGKKEKSSANLADMGFGLSQVLPLIVQSAYLPKDGLLITEQPEIHLNPKLQCTLADLFVDTAKAGKQVLVETHSEHFLMRLRRLVGEGRISSDEIAIYFVEKADNGSSVRSIPLQSNGHISPENWPKGFFEDSLREALGLASSQMTRG